MAGGVGCGGGRGGQGGDGREHNGQERPGRSPAQVPPHGGRWSHTSRRPASPNRRLSGSAPAAGSRAEVGRSRTGPTVPPAPCGAGARGSVPAVQVEVPSVRRETSPVPSSATYNPGRSAIFARTGRDVQAAGRASTARCSASARSRHVRGGAPRPVRSSRTGRRSAATPLPGARWRGRTGRRSSSRQAGVPYPWMGSDVTFPPLRGQPAPPNGETLRSAVEQMSPAEAPFRAGARLRRASKYG